MSAAVGSFLVSVLPGVCQLLLHLLNEVRDLFAGEMNQQRFVLICGEADHPIGNADAPECLAVKVNVGVAFGVDVH